jgi:nucleoside permease NupC
MVTGVFKGIAKKDSNELIAKNVPRLFLAGVLVSLLSAALVGIFVW